MKKTSHHKSSSHRSLFFWGLIVILAGVVIIFSRRSASRVGINQVSNSGGAVDLFLEPATVSIKTGEQTTLALKATSATEKIGAITVELSYSSSCGTPVVTQGEFLPNVLSTAKIQDGKIKFSYSVAPESGGLTGTGTIATIQITPPASSECSLTFTTNSGVATFERDGNALRTASDAMITTLAQRTAASPSDSASASPSPTASPSLSPSPSPSPSLAPSKTTSLRSSAVTCNSLSFSWDKLDQAQGYIIDLGTNSNFDNKVSSGTLGRDRDNYSFTNLKSGTAYYARITLTDIHDFPRYTTLSAVNTLGSCAGASLTTTSTTPKPSVKPSAKAAVKASPSPKLSASPMVQSSLTPTHYTDQRFDNLTPVTGEQTNTTQGSLFARFIAWLASLFN